MSNTDTTDQTPDRTLGRTPGPWDARPETTRARETAPAPAAEAPIDKDQSLVWAILSTALMGGFLWWITGSAIVAGAVLILSLIHI